ncbi:Na(+)-translocating NADH-quinone reductase subun it F [Desulfonema ishimotonii]|uniref:Na(+)-translocating NADH-quinone reductase subunit F n=1 Tax=Desulfonema ishimotonii TaxID=45657 RepID=A0A401FRE9_9BACT|nr:NADH:ubiquinone reductase (Na(+)-transporting) subunit F [Desulfonema ishimotonii]GBC59530.1 Na(+)-translocating NADH-quinone reductase subun it F [Desulfonema ishimotonii]
MIYIVSLLVFTAIIFALVGTLLLVESKVVRKGDCTIRINESEAQDIQVPAGATLLSSLASQKIFLPSACGGGGSCGTCKCVVDAGGRDVLPTELPHLSRREIRDHVRLACQVKVRENMNIRIPDEIFNIRKYTATVVSNKNVATFIKELVLKLDPGQRLEFRAGAYIQIDIPAYEARFNAFDVDDLYRPDWDRFNLWGLRARSEEIEYRAYSLASPPSEGDVLRFTIRIATPPPGRTDLPPGVGSSYVFNLKPGDRVTLSGPYGDFFVKETQREMCFIGGGAGMAPMRSHIFNQLRDEKTSRKLTFWYGARSWKEMFYHEDFSQLERDHENFSYHVALSEPQPEDHWDGMVGFIHQCAHDHYLSQHPDPQEIEYYLCGPPMMIDAVEKMLDSLGVEPEMIAYDKFG